MYRAWLYKKRKMPTTLNRLYNIVLEAFDFEPFSVECYWTADCQRRGEGHGTVKNFMALKLFQRYFTKYMSKEFIFFDFIEMVQIRIKNKSGNVGL
jgi:hypothetical protein